MLVWDPDEPMGGLTAQQIKMAKVLLWKGHCSVHQMFQAQHVLRWRQQNPSGMVISHPECNFEVCKLSDYVGSTDFIIKTVAASAPGTRWLVGTELNLVNRIAEEFKPQGKVVQFMAPTVCMCSTMARIDPQHLAWSLENLVAGKVVNQIKVPRTKPSSHALRSIACWPSPDVCAEAAGPGAAPRVSAATVTRSLQVVTYNIHKGLSLFNRRLVIHELRERLRTLGSDIVFLQEVQGTAIERRRSTMTGPWSRNTNSSLTPCGATSLTDVTPSTIMVTTATRFFRGIPSSNGTIRTSRRIVSRSADCFTARSEFQAGISRFIACACISHSHREGGVGSSSACASA